METPDFPQWLKIFLGIVGGTFAWGIVFFLSKEWIKTQIIEPIHELKEKTVEIRNDFTKLNDRFSSFIFKIMNNHNDLTKELSNLTRLILTTEEKAKVMVSITEKVIERHKHLETEIKKISQDLILIRDKKK